jgi:sulfate transport system permease protein
MSAPARGRLRPTGWLWLLVGATAVFLLLFVALPLLSVFSIAFSHGVGPFVHAVTTPETVAALQLTLLALAFAVPLNTIFGLTAAWAVTKFHFRGKGLILALIDLPLAVSPVVAGLVLVMLFGGRGLLGPLLLAHGIHIIYALPGIVMATVFVTFPFVARELIPLMESLGSEEEIAATSLGAGGWNTFWRVTLPNIRWGLVGGVVLCTARAMGEFGAVSVVSGHIRGETNTLSLHVEILYNEYNEVGAFAVASLLSLVGLLALAAKKWVEWRTTTESESRL